MSKWSVYKKAFEAQIKKPVRPITSSSASSSDLELRGCRVDVKYGRDFRSETKELKGAKIQVGYQWCEEVIKIKEINKHAFDACTYVRAGDKHSHVPITD
jgi:hypothetical protein